MDASKYIAVAQDEHSMPIFILFPQNINHDTMARAMIRARYPEVISAGFVDEFLQCYGESTTLRIKSKPEDTDLLHQQLSIDDKRIKF